MMNPSSFAVQWDNIREILSRPANGIRPAEYSILAQLFAWGDLAFAERFINYLVDEVHGPTTQPPFMGVQYRGWGDATSTFAFCPDKIANIQRHIDAGIIFGIALQMEPDLDADLVDEFRLATYTLMERSALLSVLASLPNGTGGNSSAQTRWPDLLVGNRDRSNSPISLSTRYFDGDPGVNVSFMAAEMQWMLPDSPPSVQPVALPPRSREIGITQAASHAGADSLLRYLSVNEFVMRYEFDMGVHLSKIGGSMTVSTVTSFIPDIIRAAGMAVSAPAVKSATLAYYGFDYISGISGEIERARQIQEDFMTMGDNWEMGTMMIIFRMTAVIVSEAGTNPVVHSWPSPDTRDGLTAFNNIINQRDGTNDGFNLSLEDIIQNPNLLYNAFRELSIWERREVYVEIDRVRDERIDAEIKAAQENEEAEAAERARRERERRGATPEYDPNKRLVID